MISRAPNPLATPLRGLVAALLLAPLAIGCSSFDPAAETAIGEFPADPLMTVSTEARALSLEVRTSPTQPPSRGSVAVEYRASDAKGAPVTGLVVELVAWMPAMGHGASGTPTVSETGEGRYVARGIDLSMAGRWELRTTFTGPASDHATVVFDVP